MTTLPMGFRARVRADLWLGDGGRTLAGGSPFRVLRLKPPAEPVRAGELLEVRDRVSDAVVARLLAAGLADPVLASGLADPGAETPAITVVVPIRDRADRLDRLLAALRGGALNVVVVDDASRDPDAVREVADRHGAHLIALTTNVGPAGARNAGLAEVATPLVAFVDSDVVVSPESLTGLAGHFTDPRVALAGPRIRGVAAGDRPPTTAERWDIGGISLDLGTEAALVRPWSRVGWLPGACMLARAGVVRDAGGFVAGQRVAEDVDLVWRLLEAGHLVRYDPGFEASHDSRSTLREWLSRRAFYGTGGAWLAGRHQGKVAPAVLRPLPALAAVALVAQRRWSVPVAGLAAIAVHQRLRTSLPDPPGLADELTRLTITSTGEQIANLALRHWWPATVLAAALGSTRARRLLLAALVWDAAGQKGRGSFTARRCDDLAYGAGLWWGALRHRSARCLLPHLVREG